MQGWQIYYYDDMKSYTCRLYNFQIREKKSKLEFSV